MIKPKIDWCNTVSSRKSDSSYYITTISQVLDDVNNWKYEVAVYVNLTNGIEDVGQQLFDNFDECVPFFELEFNND